MTAKPLKVFSGRCSILMLGKLLKNEFIATGRIMGAVYAVVAILCAYILGSYYIGKSDEASSAQALSVMVLLLISGLNIFFTTIVMVVNFQKSLYSDQGYLSFTLPVKGSTLLASKVIVSVVWFVVALLCFIGSGAISIYTVKEDVLGDSYDTIQSLLPMFLNGKSIATIITVVVVKLLVYFLSMTMITVMLYFAISLANTRMFQPHHTVWTIVFIIATVGIANAISELIADHVVFGFSVVGKGLQIVTDYSQMGFGASYVDLTTPITSLIFAAAFFYGTFYLMNKKVNIR